MIRRSRYAGPPKGQKVKKQKSPFGPLAFSPFGQDHDVRHKLKS